MTAYTLYYGVHEILLVCGLGSMLKEEISRVLGPLELELSFLIIRLILKHFILLYI